MSARIPASSVESMRIVYLGGSPKLSSTAAVDYYSALTGLAFSFTRSDPEQWKRKCNMSDVMCDHGLQFDPEEAKKILGSWEPQSIVEFVMGNPRHVEVRKRFPRLHGECPKKCGFVGIAYASSEHYVMGDW